jgi:hypothetical protein
VGRSALPWAAAAFVLLVPAIAGNTSAHADMLNGQSLVPSSPNLITYTMNPFPSDGKIASLAGISDGNNLAVLWAGGRVRIYDSGMNSIVNSSVYGTKGNVGISEVPTTYLGKGANFAIARVNGIDFFDLNGNYKGSLGVAPGGHDIRDIRWDAAYNRLLMCNADGIGKINDDGSVTPYVAGGSVAAQPLHMTDGYANMLFQNPGQNPGLRVLNADGTINAGIPAKQLPMAKEMLWLH